MSVSVIRSCDGCIECCKGYFSGEALGSKFFLGRPCHYVGQKGCTVYSDRPQNPCASFKCGWLENPEVFPEWMKPNVANIIAQKERTKNGIEFYKIVECDKQIEASTLNYLILMAINKGVNIQVQVKGAFFVYGKNEFLNDMEMPPALNF